MQILVFGAGAIGSFLGYRLARAGHDVTLIARDQYARAVRERGLQLYESGADTESGFSPVYPEAAASVGSLPLDRRTWDLIILTVKVYDARSAAQALAPFIQAHVPLLVVQNGVGGEDLVQAEVPGVRLLSGVMTLSVSIMGPARVRLETTRGGINLASVTEGQSIALWATLFEEAGLRTAVYPDYRALKWSKLLLNILANAIPAILDMSPGAVFANPALFAVERAAFMEAVAVVRSLGLKPVGFPSYPVPLLVWAMEALPRTISRPLLKRLVASGRGDKRPSLHIDLASGRKGSEVLYLNGAVATHAEQLDIPAPVNRFLVDALMGILADPDHWRRWRGQPDNLLSALRRSGS
jgi:2-dehydropantoate 2-reductase